MHPRHDRFVDVAAGFEELDAAFSLLGLHNGHRHLKISKKLPPAAGVIP
jgi:hypothetical protein